MPYTNLNRAPGTPDIEAFIANREAIRKDLEIALELFNAKMAVYLDAGHRPPRLNGKAYVKLTKAGKVGYQLPRNSNLINIKMGPYSIKRKVGELAYELEPSPHIRIHPVISCIYLEYYKEDTYYCRLRAVGSVGACWR